MNMDRAAGGCCLQLPGIARARDWATISRGTSNTDRAVTGLSA